MLHCEHRHIGHTADFLEIALKKYFVLTALVVTAGIAVTVFMQDSATTEPAAATTPPHGGMSTKEGTTSPHGGMSIKEGAASPHGAAPIGADAAMPPGHPPAIPADTNLVNSGEVLEVIDSPMYTYLQVTSDKGPLWLAAFKTDIAKGAAVRYSSGVAMSGFYSKSLDRTFDTIVFVDSLAPEEK